MVTEADHLLKRGDVSAMLKLGFLPSPTRSPPPIASPSPPVASPPPTSQPSPQTARRSPKPPPLPIATPQRRYRLQERVSSVLQAGAYAASGPGDVELSVTDADGFKASLTVHRKVLVEKSGFFAEKLVAVGATHLIEICECDDAEVYVEVVALMYCEDLRAMLAGEGVEKVLSLLKVSAAIAFEEGVESCLEHLEAIPWSEVQEERVVVALSHIQVYKPVLDVLERVSKEPCSSAQASGILSRLLGGVLQAKDEKARREMKALVSKLVRGEGVCRNAQEKETLQDFCHRCLNSLHSCLSEAADAEEEGIRDRSALMGDIARGADNLQWVVEILIIRRLGEGFVGLWADQKDLAMLHSRIPCIYRYEISKITMQLCIAIGGGRILVSKQARLDLLQTWLEALYEDFGWIKRTCKTLDKRAMEDGLGQTILTLPMPQQRTILLNWFERFLSRGDDCPNIQWAFEVWWRRAFARKHDGGSKDDSNLQIAVWGSPLPP